MTGQARGRKPRPARQAAAEKRYSVDITELQRRPMSIGETREFGRIARLELAPGGQIQIDYANFDAMVAAIYILLKRQNPRITLAELDRLDWSQLNVTFPDSQEDEAVVDEVPTPAPA